MYNLEIIVSTFFVLFLVMIVSEKTIIDIISNFVIPFSGTPKSDKKKVKFDMRKNKIYLYDKE